MVHIAKKYLDDKLKEEIENNLLERIKKIKTRQGLKEFSEKLFTKSELIMLEKRLAIKILCNKGLSYKEISRMIDVSPHTIGFVKNGLIKKPVVHKKYSSGSLEKLSNKKSRFRLPSYGGKDRWKFLNSN